MYSAYCRHLPFVTLLEIHYSCFVAAIRMEEKRYLIAKLMGFVAYTINTMYKIVHRAIICAHSMMNKLIR